jgi:hypothetical protein
MYLKVDDAQVYHSDEYIVRKQRMRFLGMQREKP